MKRTVEKHGDGSHPIWGHGHDHSHHESPVKAIPAPGEEDLGY